MHLNRATIVYSIMILASAVGVWAVLSIGEGMVAPEDLAGKWTLESRLDINRPTTQEAPAPGMAIEQSGKFFQISFENGPNLNLELQNPTTPSAGNPLIELVREPWRLTLQGSPGGDEKEIHLIGPNPQQCGVWNAKRHLRKFPFDVADSKPNGAH